MHDILLVDDHKIMRDGIRAILKVSGEFNVVAEADSGLDAVTMTRSFKPQLVLMDIHLPGLNGIEATVEILRYNPETRVVILSMYEDENSVVQAIRSGARAFVLKKASDLDLLDALRTVARGGSYLSPQVSDKFLNRVQRGDLNERKSTSALDSLTPREKQVMRMVAEGKTSKEIAILLDLGLQTVRGYRKTLMKKLEVSNVAGVTQIALAHGLARTTSSGSGR
ncbi:MAG: response regulator transcription factor [Bryobacterales bacterium]|nr:response regulator transcription factor [Bryobacterales bacterium]